MAIIETLKYEGTEISDSGIRDRVRQAIENHEKFYVSNENLGGDPKPGERKRCWVRWRDQEGGPLIEDTVYEGNNLDFTHYIRKITYGDREITNDSSIYDRLHGLWRYRDNYNEGRKWSPFAGLKDPEQVELGNGFFGFDPKPGVRKEVIIELSVKDPHEEDSWYRYDEGTWWPPKDVDTDQYVDSAIGSEAVGQVASSMMSFRY